ncbi:MAG: RluA family pseudouridine synthase [Deltaproteobacteria bacterium]|nr:RluA family pseudouridine synthase [Deltaproteobacteria bacterium]
MFIWPPFELVVSNNEVGQRLDIFLTNKLSGFSRERVRMLLRQHRVYVDGKIKNSSMRLNVNMKIIIKGIPPANAPLPIANHEIPLSLIYEDKHILAVNKEAGMASLPLSPDETDTLANALIARYPELCGIGHSILEAGLLHRLDNNTSGVLLVARSSEVFAKLQQQFSNNTVLKKYLALVDGHPQQTGVIKFPIKHDITDRRRMIADIAATQNCDLDNINNAITHFKVIEYKQRHTLIEVSLHQGVRHQIRVHLAAIGHPLAGDLLYGGSNSKQNRHFLHASEIHLQHPITSIALHLKSALPVSLENWLKKI